MTTLCRLCLCTDKKLLELSERLVNYFQDICDYNTGFSKHLFCSQCGDALKNNLDFRDKCLLANKIFQQWAKNKSQSNMSIKSLHELLQPSYNKDNKGKFIEIINGKITMSCYENNIDCEENDEDINISNNSIENDRINLAIVRNEETNEYNFEIINCGTENTNNKCIEIIKAKNTISSYESNSDCEENYEQINISVNTNIHNKHIENDKIRYEIEEIEDKNDDIFEIIDCGTDNDETNCSESDNDDGDIIHERIEESDNELGTNTPFYQIVPEKRFYPRKTLSEYSKYEEIFEIQLFGTDEEARSELSQRKVSEPYLSAAYRCEQCYTVYKCDKLLKFHMTWHNSSGELVCDICSMRFSVQRTLQTHRYNSHRGKFTCKLCPVVTYYHSTMKAHYEKHKGKKFKCHCGRFFSHITSYLTHKRIAHTSSHVCVTCARTFVSERGLLNHRVRVHKTKSKVDSDATARCEPCALTFASQQVYNVHVLNTELHADVAASLTACKYCGLSFDDTKQLKAHKQKHPKKHQCSQQRANNTITCQLCGAEGQGRAWRWHHYRSMHPDVQYRDEFSKVKVLICDRCGKRFTSGTKLKDHLSCHAGVKPYECAVCRKRFSSVSARTVHLERLAAPTRTCVHCCAYFRSASNLAAHMHKHVGGGGSVSGTAVARRHVKRVGRRRRPAPTAEDGDSTS